MRSSEMGVLVATHCAAPSKSTPLIIVKLISNAPGCASRSASAPRNCRHSADGELGRHAAKAANVSSSSVMSGGGIPELPVCAGLAETPARFNRAFEEYFAGYADDPAAILGRPFAIQGEVIHGDKRGRTIGVPTANIPMGDYMRPAYGVYATRTRLPDGREIAGVANIGVNPTVPGEIAPRLEVWLFDFDEDLYDQVIETDLVAYLRPEEKFDSLEAMVEQINADAAQARALLLPEF